MEEDLLPVQPPSIDEYNLKATLEAAQDELVKLLRDRESLEWRINKLQNDIVHLAALCHVEVEDPLTQLGLTDAVRWILASGKRPLGVQQIVEQLHKSYSDASEYKNLPANVHTIVRRLVKANEVKPAVEPPQDYRPVKPRDAFSLVVKGTTGAKYVWAGGIPPLPPPPGWLRERAQKVKK
jgi:hypothetical protein